MAVGHLVTQGSENPVIAFSIFEESSQIPLQRFWFDFFKVLRHPRDLLNDSLGNWRIELLKLPTG
jgi:hypothetical protein